MTDRLFIRNTLRLAVPIAFLAAAAIGGCAGVDEARGGEHGGEHGVEESGTTLAPGQTYDQVRKGARLMLRYDAKANAFTGTVRNTTDGTLSRVRVEVHLSNGTELGPTTPVDLAPGEQIDVLLLATDAAFTGWSAHAEVGGGAGGEHGADGEHGGERREGRGEHGGGGEHGDG